MHVAVTGMLVVEKLGAVVGAEQEKGGARSRILEAVEYVFLGHVGHADDLGQPEPTSVMLRAHGKLQ